MSAKSKTSLIVWMAAGVMTATLSFGAHPMAQAGQGARGGGAGRGAGGAGGDGGPGLGAFPQRPPADPQVLERGKALYSVNCQFCHGADTRGGDSGPSLLRSPLVQDDRSGELIAPVLQAGRPPTMPKFDFTAAQIADLAAFVHSFTLNSRDPARMRPDTIVTGDAIAGEQYFNAKCGMCHSVSGDLKSLTSRFPDPRNLQQWWLLPGVVGRGGGRGRGADAVPVSNLKPVTATITAGTGEKFEGRLMRIDEFTVSVVDGNGVTRTFARNGDTPKVDVHDPLKPHKELLRVYTDKDIHDVTAYLVKQR